MAYEVTNVLGIARAGRRKSPTKLEATAGLGSGEDLAPESDASARMGV